MGLEFGNPWVLYLLWLVPLLPAVWMGLHRRREAALQAFVSSAMQTKLRPRRDTMRSLWQMIVVTVGVALMLFAAGRPRWGVKEETVVRRGRDVVIALDVSRSMLADDVHPNRLQRAKADLLDLINDLQGDRAALLAFRRKANVVCPLTSDYAFLREALEGVGPTSAPRGETDIGDAITKALDAFESEESAHKAIILISDGEDLTGRALEAADQAAKRGIPIFTVGIGSPSGSRIPLEDNPQGNVQHEGKDVVTRLHHETLDAIARRTHGAYVPIGRASTATTTLGTLYRNRLRRIAAQELAETLHRRHIERYQLFLLPGLVFLLAGCVLSRGRLSVGRPSVAAPPPEDGAADAPPEGTPALRNLNPPRKELKEI